jgi:hypothetical protein
LPWIASSLPPPRRSVRASTRTLLAAGSLGVVWQLQGAVGDVVKGVMGLELALIADLVVAANAMERVARGATVRGRGRLGGEQRGEVGWERGGPRHAAMRAAEHLSSLLARDAMAAATPQPPRMLPGLGGFRVTVSSPPLGRWILGVHRALGMGHAQGTARQRTSRRSPSHSGW